MKTLPPMNRATSAEYQATAQLHGRKGTFIMGDPDGKTKRGNASQNNLTIASNTAIGAYQIPVSGLTNSQSNALVKGDYIQFGTGAGAKLHMIVADASASSSGTATLTIEPALKVAITASTTCVITNTVGVWRMDTNDLNWDSNHASIYGFSLVVRVYVMKKDELEVIVREDPKLMIMLRVASEEGAKGALAKVGLEDADAPEERYPRFKVVDSESYRTAKRTATETIIKAFVVFTLGLISMGVLFQMVEIDMQLTKNFSLREFTKSQTAERMGIDNTPPEEIIPKLSFLATQILEPLEKK